MCLGGQEKLQEKSTDCQWKLIYFDEPAALAPLVSKTVGRIASGRA